MHIGNIQLPDIPEKYPSTVEMHCFPPPPPPHLMDYVHDAVITY